MTAQLSIGIRLCTGVLVLAVWTSHAAGANPEAIGTFTTVQGKVLVQHSGAPAAVSVKQHDDVFFRAVIETQRASKTRALFLDDTLLTVGENSRVEITEQIYDPDRNMRSLVANLVRGKIRALVGRIFEGAGSKFEVHTPTAVAAARGTYFVVWIEEEKPAQVGARARTPQVRPVAFSGETLAQLPGGATGVANIGTSGAVSLTSAGQTVLVNPGQFSIAPPGLPPMPPAIMAPTAPAAASAATAIKSTEVKDAPKPESPKEVLQATGGNAPVGAPPALPAPAPTPVASGGQPGGTDSGGTQAPTTPVTPPAVVSGAAPPEVNPAATSRITLGIRLP